MVRCFEDGEVIHVAGKVDAVSDMEVINLELTLADIAQIERRLERLGKGRAKSAAEKAKDEEEKVVLAKISDGLSAGKPARSIGLNEDEQALIEVLQVRGTVQRKMS